MSGRLLVFVLIALALGAGTYWFLQNFEQVDHRYHVGMSGAARDNPLLAAERTLARLGMQSSRIGVPRDHTDLPATGVVILSEARDALTPSAQQILLDWVDAGGHLITEDRAIDRGDALLDALSVSATKGRTAERRTVTVEWMDRTYKVQMHAEQSLQTDQALLAEAHSGKTTHMLHFRYGAGYVTVLNDLYFMTNKGLDEADHADFLWALAQSGNGGDAVAFLHESDGLSLRAWLVEHAPAVLVSGALLLLLWLWRIVPRFGRVATDDGDTRRDLLEHLAAAGRLQWHHGAGPQLAESARVVLMQRLLRRHPALRGLQSKTLAVELKKRYTLSDEQAQSLAAGGNVAGTPQFLAALQLYQRLHARLARRRTREQQP